LCPAALHQLSGSRLLSGHAAQRVPRRPSPAHARCVGAEPLAHPRPNPVRRPKRNAGTGTRTSLRARARTDARGRFLTLHLSMFHPCLTQCTALCHAKCSHTALNHARRPTGRVFAVEANVDSPARPPRWPPCSPRGCCLSSTRACAGEQACAAPRRQARTLPLPIHRAPRAPRAP
jgi:hypothetical protein